MKKKISGKLLVVDDNSGIVVLLHDRKGTIFDFIYLSYDEQKREKEDRKELYKSTLTSLLNHLDCLCRKYKFIDEHIDYCVRLEGIREDNLEAYLEFNNVIKTSVTKYQLDLCDDNLGNTCQVGIIYR